MTKIKKVTVTMTSEHQDKAKLLSKVLFGKENLSGFLGYLIEWCNEEKIKKNKL